MPDGNTGSSHRGKRRKSADPVQTAIAPLKKPKARFTLFLGSTPTTKSVSELLIIMAKHKPAMSIQNNFGIYCLPFLAENLLVANLYEYTSIVIHGENTQVFDPSELGDTLTYLK